MRLLSTESLQLKQFNDEEQLPPYAILSHTWGEEEVTFEDHQREDVIVMKGYRKMEQACKIAAKDGFQYMWIDTCCIDKSSSAELSEAINSMFKWYARSEKCYAYLEDIVWDERPWSGDTYHQDEYALHLGRSLWFTRGWTLQELIAPFEVFFYDKSWRLIGTRTSLADALVKTASIDREVLVDIAPYVSRTHYLQVLLRERSVAQRMSWASKRKTTQPEDLAYCLLGIFDIPMPLLYGEGIGKAFRRLQMEILRYSTDQSILAWTLRYDTDTFTGVLASHPRDFESCGKIARMPTYEGPLKATNQAIELHIRLLPLLDGSGDAYFGALACREEDDFSNCLAIPLEINTRHETFRSRRKGLARQLDRSPGKIALRSLENTPWQPISLLPRPPYQIARACSPSSPICQPHGGVMGNSKNRRWNYRARI